MQSVSRLLEATNLLLLADSSLVMEVDGNISQSIVADGNPSPYARQPVVHPVAPNIPPLALDQEMSMPSTSGHNAGKKTTQRQDRGLHNRGGANMRNKQHGKTSNHVHQDIKKLRRAIIETKKRIEWHLKNIFKQPVQETRGAVEGALPTLWEKLEKLQRCKACLDYLHSS